MYTNKFIEEARKVGFTDEQLDFLCKHFSFTEADY